MAAFKYIELAKAGVNKTSQNNWGGKKKEGQKDIKGMKREVGPINIKAQGVWFRGIDDANQNWE